MYIYNQNEKHSKVFNANNSHIEFKENYYCENNSDNERKQKLKRSFFLSFTLLFQAFMCVFILTIPYRLFLLAFCKLEINSSNKNLLFQI